MLVLSILNFGEIQSSLKYSLNVLKRYHLFSAICNNTEKQRMYDIIDKNYFLSYLKCRKT